MLDFSRVWLIVAREWRTRLRQRSFQITTIVQVLFVVAAASAPAVIARFAGDAAPSTSEVLVIDQAGVNAVERLTPHIGAGDEVPLDFGENAIVLAPSDLEASEAARQVDEGAADAALIVTRDASGDLAFNYVNDDGETDSIAQRIYAGVSSIAMEDRLERSGIDQDAFAAAIAPAAFTLESATGEAAEPDEEEEFGGSEIVLAYFFTIVMFMAIMLYGTWVAQGVVEEKSSRIMEIMVNAATPRDLLAGKVIGIGAAGLTQLLPMLLAGGLAFSQQERIARWIGADPADLPDADFTALSVTTVGWFLVYFLGGFLLYASLYAALGSLVSRQEEVNQAVSPMMTVMMIGYLSAFFTMFAPETLYARVLSIVPLTSPFIMLARVLMGDPPAWEMALSVGLLLLAVLLAILFAARVYRMGVLWYGQKPSWRALFTRRLESASSR